MISSFFKIFTLKWAGLLLVSASIFAFVLSEALANGGTRPLVTDARAGPYELRVGIFPGEPKVGILHLSILVKDAEAGTSITDATVTVTLTGPQGATTAGPVQATNNPQSPQVHDVNVTLDIAGSWTLNLETASPLGTASLEVPLEVAQPGGVDLIYPLVGSVAVLALVVWTWERFKGRRKKRRTKTRG